MDPKQAEYIRIARAREKLATLLIFEKRLRRVEDAIKRFPLMLQELARLSKEVKKK